MQSLWRDLGFGARILARRPGFTAAALLSLILGIGLNTAIFTLLDAIFLRPLPVKEVDSLTAVFATFRNEAGEYTGDYSYSYANYLDLRERSSSFSGTTLYLWLKMSLSGGSEPTRGTGMFVTDNYFEVLGLAPHTGRFFRPEENATHGTHPVVVLSYGCWSRLFGADGGVVGDTVQINGSTFTVIGIAPRGFKGTEVGTDVDFWVPTMMFKQISPYAHWFDNRSAGLFRVIGRLAPGVTEQQASAELMRLSQRLEEEFPKDNEGLGGKVQPLLEGTMVPSDRPRHIAYGRTLVIAVGLILLMSCFNVASLLLLRGMERGREVAVRQSLGASRPRLVRQLVAENLLLFLLGGALSLPVARMSLDLIWKFRPPQFAEDALVLELDAAIFGFALVTALACGLIFGLLPAIRVARLELVPHLKATPAADVASRVNRWRLAGRWRRWLQPRRLLVIAQMALALIALIGAGLFLRSLENAHRIDVGFDAEALLALSFAPGEQGWDEVRTRAFYDRVLERVEALPGVSSATLSENRLLRGGIIWQPIFLEGQDTVFEGAGRPAHRTNAVVPGFFETVGIPLIVGNDFDDSIRADGPPVVIVNQTMAKLAWPGEDPIGKRFRFNALDQPLVEVIGVVRDMKYRHIHEAPQCFFYLPEIQRHASSATLHVRAKGDPAALLATVREEVYALAPELPLADVRTMSEFVDEALWIERVSAILLSVFGALALALATLGVYSVLAESVGQRRQEIGVRLAVGASRSDLLRVVMADGVKLIAAGLVIGLVAAAALLRLASTVSSQLHDVSVTDPGVYALAVLVLAIAALIGFLVPALRALRTDPVRALQSE